MDKLQLINNSKNCVKYNNMKKKYNKNNIIIKKWKRPINVLI